MAFKNVRLDYLVPKDEIFYISWIIDACDELAMLETLDAKSGHIVIWTTLSLEKYVKDLMAYLKNENIEVTAL